jgi:hypothetical protein
LDFSTELTLDNSGLSVAPPMRPRASTHTIAPPPVWGFTIRHRRQEVESGDEALEANTAAAKGEVGQPPAPAESGDEATKGEKAQPLASAKSSESLAKPAKSVRSSAQSDGLDMVDDEQTSAEVNMYGQDDYDDVGSDGNQEYDIPPDGFQLYKEENGEDSNQDFANDEEVMGERPQPKRGREHAESGNPRVKKSGGQSIAHSNASTTPPTCDSSPSQVDHQGASHTTGGIFRGNATGGYFKWGDAPQFVDHESEFESAPMGKMLLFASHDEETRPHLSIGFATVSVSPAVLC